MYILKKSQISTYYKPMLSSKGKGNEKNENTIIIYEHRDNLL